MTLACAPIALALTGCGATNYNTDLGALASAVQGAEHGHLVNVRCVGEIPYESQKRIKARLQRNTYYRYTCSGETKTHPPASVKRIIRVSPNGNTWFADKQEEREAAQEQRASSAAHARG